MSMKYFSGCDFYTNDNPNHGVYILMKPQKLFLAVCAKCVNREWECKVCQQRMGTDFTTEKN